MTLEDISQSISTKECCRTQQGSNLGPPDHQSDAHATGNSKNQNVGQYPAMLRICTESDEHSEILMFWYILCTGTQIIPKSYQLRRKSQNIN